MVSTFILSVLEIEHHELECSESKILGKLKLIKLKVMNLKFQLAIDFN